MGALGPMEVLEHFARKHPELQRHLDLVKHKIPSIQQRLEELKKMKEGLQGKASLTLEELTKGPDELYKIRVAHEEGVL